MQIGENDTTVDTNVSKRPITSEVYGVVPLSPTSVIAAGWNGVVLRMNNDGSMMGYYGHRSADIDQIVNVTAISHQLATSKRGTQFVFTGDSRGQVHITRTQDMMAVQGNLNAGYKAGEDIMDDAEKPVVKKLVYDSAERTLYILYSFRQKDAGGASEERDEIVKYLVSISDNADMDTSDGILKETASFTQVGASVLAPDTATEITDMHVYETMPGGALNMYVAFGNGDIRVYNARSMQEREDVYNSNLRSKKATAIGAHFDSESAKLMVYVGYADGWVYAYEIPDYTNYASAMTIAKQSDGSTERAVQRQADNGRVVQVTRIASDASDSVIFVGYDDLRIYQIQTKGGESDQLLLRGHYDFAFPGTPASALPVTDIVPYAEDGYVYATATNGAIHKAAFVTVKDRYTGLADAGAKATTLSFIAQGDVAYTDSTYVTQDTLLVGGSDGSIHHLRPDASMTETSADRNLNFQEGNKLLGLL